MNTKAIVLAIRERCPVFEERVGGAAEFGRLADTSSLDTPCAYVIPLGETGEEPLGKTGYRQVVQVNFAVVCVVSARKDERGQDGNDQLDQLRTELFRALLAWSPEGDASSEIEFDSSELLNLDRSRLFYQFEFNYRYQLVTADTWQPIYRASLGDLKTVDVDVRGTNADPEKGTVAHAIFNLEKT